MIKSVGLICGEGAMPLKIARNIKQKNENLVAIGIKGSCSKEIEKIADKTYWGYPTQLGKARKIFLANGVESAILAGRVHHNSIFKLALHKMDWVTLKAFLNLKNKQANSLLKGIISVFEEKGIKFMSSIEYLQKEVSPKGSLTHKSPCDKLKKDIELGYKIAKELGQLDIGQTVVIKNQSVIALEAMEGTDHCIERAYSLAGPGCCVVKVSKPNQDMRFDVPVIGKNTIEKLIKIKAKAIAIEAEKTVILDPEVVTYANKHNIVIVAI